MFAPYRTCAVGLRRAVFLPRHFASNADSSQLGFLEQLQQQQHSDLPPPTAGSEGYGKEGPRQGSDKNPMRRAAAAEAKQRTAVRLRLHCQATGNNTITTLADAKGNVLHWYSGGRCGFKKGQRSTFEAGYQCAVRMFADIEKLSTANMGIDLFLKGFGFGREAMQKALMASEGERVRNLIRSVTDTTRIKVGGTRPKKRRRL